MYNILMGNSNMRKAKGAKKDEFYTQFPEIVNELSNYKSEYRGTVVWCPCDDYDTSNFCKFFEGVKSEWGIVKLIFTSYPNGKTRVVNTNGSIRDLVVGDGDFRSKEVQDFVKKEAQGYQITCGTNPPFSIFDEFLYTLEEMGVKHCTLGAWNAFFNKEVWKLYFHDKLWLGYGRNKTMTFEVPDDYKGEIIDGKKMCKVPGISWWTNFPIGEKVEKFKTDCKYDSETYPTYSNFDAIHVSNTNKIPMDYDGLMGVPGNYINVHDGENFEIVGVFNGYAESNPEDGLFCGERLETTDTNGKKTKFSGPVLPHPTIPNAYKAKFGRLLIRKKLDK